MTVDRAELPMESMRAWARSRGIKQAAQDTEEPQDELGALKKELEHAKSYEEECREDLGPINHAGPRGNGYRCLSNAEDEVSRLKRNVDTRPHY